MAYTYKFDVNAAVNRGFYCKARLKSGNIDFVLEEEALLDTGATVCHISFPLWCNIGLNKVCFEEKRELFSKVGINSPNEMTFDALPLKKHTTRLGKSMMPTEKRLSS